MKKYIALIASTTALSACSAASDTNALEPGKWELTSEMVSFSVPGATPEQEEFFQTNVGVKDTDEQCLTEKEAAQGPEFLVGAFDNNDECSLTKFSIENGEIDGVMACKVEGVEEPSLITISGTHSPQAMSMTITGDIIEEQLPGGKATMEMAVSGKKIGSCD